MRYDFHPEAIAEYEEAALYYAERDPEVDSGSLQPSMTRSTEFSSPRSDGALDEDVRRCLTRVFPYGVLYTIEPEFVLIVAVMHCSREPGYWKGRLAKP